MTELLLVKCRRVVVIALHVAIVVAAYYSAFVLRFNGAIDPADFRIFMRTLPLVAATQLGVFIPFRLYRGLWRYVGIRDLKNIIGATLASTIIASVLIEWVLGVRGYPRSVYVIDALLLIVFLGGVRMGRRLYHDIGALEAARRVLLIGAGDAGEMIVRDMLNNPFYSLQPIGFVDDDRSKIGHTIHNLPVLGTRRELPQIISSHSPDEILVAIARAEPRLLREIVRSLEPYKLPIKTLPNLRDLLNGAVTVSQIRDVSLEDLLQRGPAGLDPRPLRRLIAGRRVLVTGAGGSIGSELCRQLSALEAGLLLMFERYENALYAIDDELRTRGSQSELVPLLGDATNRVRLREVFERYRPEIVLHAAAHKHVPLVELNVCEAVKNNLGGTRAVAEYAARYGAERFILISTDKAVHPSSVMGATKRAGELIVRHLSRGSGTCFAMVRFGNVLGSNGSVIPKFLAQIRAGGPVTVTNPEMERFFMTIPEAVNLVLHAATLETSGALYALDMGRPIKVVDMARHLIRLSGFIPGEEIRIEFTGLRPGEKLSEQLFDDNERSAPSAIPQIMKIIGAAPDRAAGLYDDLVRLETLAARGAEETVIAELMRIVPGFRPLAPAYAADRLDALRA